MSHAPTARPARLTRYQGQTRQAPRLERANLAALALHAEGLLVTLDPTTTPEVVYMGLRAAHEHLLDAVKAHDRAHRG